MSSVNFGWPRLSNKPMSFSLVLWMERRMAEKDRLEGIFFAYVQCRPLSPIPYQGFVLGVLAGMRRLSFVFSALSIACQQL